MTERWSGPRLAAAAVLASWALLFWFLLATGRTDLYLSGRTAWVVPLGAVLLTVATVGRVATARTTHDERLGTSERWILAAIALPVVLLVALPPATLGAYAAGRRATFSGGGGLITPDDFEHGPLTMVHVAAAQGGGENLAKLRARAGEEVDLEGFVVRNPDTPPDELLLTRFIVTCCAADATTAQVRVVNVPPGRYGQGDWLEVTGRIYPIARQVVVAADGVERIPPPDSPYLTVY
ncbi:MAG TPA: TIGR03943 family protein [Actinomycetota bacterium]|jgi:uncharacterized repeat protein (TIGR03943 family)